jgi:ABC-2 type transport system ATP-binding protein
VIRNAVVVDRLHKRMGVIDAVADLSFSVGVGTCLALLGPNGAGKSTTLRVLSTLVKPDGGCALVNGFNVATEPRKARASLSFAGQQTSIQGELTGRENLVVLGMLHRLGWRPSRARAAELLDLFDLAEAGGRLAKTYSGGMLRRLDLAASLVARPPVLLLDEPTVGLDPKSRDRTWEFLRHLTGDGTSVLLTTQYLEEADALADDIVIIDRGSVVASGRPSDLKLQFGTMMIDFVVKDRTEVDAALMALNDMQLGRSEIDRDRGAIMLAVEASESEALIRVVRHLDDKGIGISDLALRQPTLEDVFLRLT